MLWYVNYISKKSWHLGFPGGAVVKSLPANAGDTGLIPGPGRSHMPRSNWARAPQLLSLRSGAREPRVLKPPAPGARAPQQERPLHWEACALQRKVAPARRS